MNSKAIFLDRDGTLVKDHGYVHKREDFALLNNVIEGLQLLHEYRLFIVTNQSGISRGKFTQKDMQEFNDHLVEELKEHHIHIEEVYFCPHSPQEGCQCRKPSTGMIRQASEKFDIDLKNSYVIGDHATDIELAKNAGCHGILVLTGQGSRYIEQAKNKSPYYIAADVEQAARIISFSQGQKIITRETLSQTVENIRKQNKTIVTLNGTFDILHEGHAKILKESKVQGDVLIVGVNADSSVKENKGESRPFNNEQQRAKMLATFKEVDYVVVFKEKTPIPLLEIIKPNVHVNGSEYSEDCIEAPTVTKNGGRIHVVELLQGFSTTNLVERGRKEISNQ